MATKKKENVVPEIIDKVESLEANMKAKSLRSRVYL